MDVLVKSSSFIKGKIGIPPDKSISHRAIIIASIAEGKSKIINFLNSEDTLSTLGILRKMGARIKESSKTALSLNLEVEGKGLYLQRPAEMLDAGNSGTTLRLLAGILSAQHFNTRISGDSSLQKRPMKRIILPLRKMGADIKGKAAAADEECPPLTIKGQDLKSLPSPFRLNIASAQVKSCLLFAHLYTRGKTSFIQCGISRDHTERMLKYAGASITCGKRITLVSPSALKAKTIRIPGDISSAAFFIGAGLILKNSRLLIKNVGVNPTRTGFIDVLRKMGAKIKITAQGFYGNEPVADITVASSNLKGIEIKGELIPLLIDEIPLLGLLASQAKGRTIIAGAGELRFKESDRLQAITRGLRKMGAHIKELKEGLIIDGPVQLRPANVHSYADHRIAMTLIIAGLIAPGETRVIDTACVQISFPSFIALLKKVGGQVDYCY